MSSRTMGVVSHSSTRFFISAGAEAECLNVMLLRYQLSLFFKMESLREPCLRMLFGNLWMEYELINLFFSFI